MLARVSLAGANLRSVTPEERLRKTKEYARRRLQEEVRKGPRGTQARLAEALRISTAHVTNLSKKGGTALPGEDVLPRLAEHWGLTGDELEALATGLPVRRAIAEPTVEADRTIEIFREVGEANRYSPREIEFASESVRGLAGDYTLSRPKVLELLAQARMTLRNAARVLREPEDVITDAGTDNPLDDLGGGFGAIPPPKRRRK